MLVRAGGKLSQCRVQFASVLFTQKAATHILTQGLVDSKQLNKNAEVQV